MNDASTAPAWPAGFRINPRRSTLSAELIEAFRDVPAAHASDCMGRPVGSVGLKSYHGFGQMCGPALTVRIFPGDNLMIHKSLDVCQPGDIIVVDGGGDIAQCLIGGLMRCTALAKKVGGFVLDGAVRDIAEFADGKMPCYARAHGHRGPSKNGPGEINVPIACAGMAVMPGDLMLGDGDGVICIPAADAEALLPLVRAHAAKEDRIREANLAGKTDSERLDALLREKGVPAELLKAQ